MTALKLAILAAIALPLLLAVLYFNRFVKYRNRVNEAWSGVDVQLKRRHDLIPPLVAAVKAYAAHERDVLETLSRTRSAASGATDVHTSEAGERQLTQSLRPLLALAEAYPDLKANQNFADLQAQLVAVEDALQMARRYYDGTVRDFNTLVEIFPGNLIARACGFSARAFFEIETATERLAPRVVLGEGEAGHAQGPMA